MEFAHLVNLEALGGFVTKGLSREPIDGAPAPRVCETASGMLNAIGLQNVGVRTFVAEKLPVLRKIDTAVVVNVFGYALEDYVEVIRVLEDHEGVAAGRALDGLAQVIILDAEGVLAARAGDASGHAECPLRAKVGTPRATRVARRAAERRPGCPAWG